MLINFICLGQFRSKTAFVGHFFSELQKCFQLPLLLTPSLTILGTAGIWTDNLCPQSDENAGNLISVVQFLVMVIIQTVLEGP